MLCPHRWFYIVVVPIDRVGGNLLAPRWNTPEELELDEVPRGRSVLRAATWWAVAIFP